MKTLLFVPVLAGALSLPLAAQGGVPGFVLTMPSPAFTGADYNFCLETPGSAIAFLMTSIELLPAPIQTSAGPFYLQTPLIATQVIGIPASGELCITCVVPCFDTLEGVTVHFQFGALTAGGRGLSNVQTVTVEEGDCDVDAGDFATFTQGGWGAACSGDNAGCLRDQNFAAVFPGGLILGDQDGVDGDGLFALVLTDAQAVEDFIPEGGPAGALLFDDTDPAGSPAGVLSGQATAAKMNVGFDDAGVLDALKANDAFKLGDLVYVANVDPDLFGLTVREVIELADKVLSGELGTSVDLDNDTVADVDASDLADALGALNENFVDGIADEGTLAMP